MSNYYKSNCCDEQVEMGSRHRTLQKGNVYDLYYVCSKCKKECEVTAMIDKPGGVPELEITNSKTVQGRVDLSLGTEAYIGGVDLKPTANQDEISNRLAVDEQQYQDDIEAGVEMGESEKDKLIYEFMDLWESNKKIVGLGEYSDIITQFWLDKMTRQKAEIVSLIMGMDLQDKKRESDEYDRGRLSMQADIINKLRGITQ